jgi:hypothetical protein
MSFKVVAICGGLFASLLLNCAAAAAPAVSIDIRYNDDGTGSFTRGAFAIYAEASPDSGGIFAYGVDLTGPPLDFLGNAGQGVSFRKTSFPTNTRFAGFLAGFSADQAAGKISGLQDLSKGADLIPVYGLGQVTGDLLSLRPSTHTGVVDLNGNGTAYGPKLLLGVGFVDESTGKRVTDVRFDTTSVDNKVSVFDNCTGIENVVANIQYHYVGVPVSGLADLSSPAAVTPCAVPEPGMVIPGALMAIAVLWRPRVAVR